MSGPPVTASWCGRWDPVQLRQVEPLTESEARRRYAVGPTFAVVLFADGEDLPEAVLDVDAGASRVLVSFFEGYGALSMTYLFRRRGTQLFLEQVDSYWYTGQELVDELGADLAVHHPWAPAHIVRHEQYWVRPDGVGRLTVDDARDATIQSEDRRGIPVEDAWQPVPAFDDLHRLARPER